MAGLLDGRVSVVVPSHDDLATLRDAVASVLTQSVPVRELIVVDDASTDGTADWLARTAGVRSRSIQARSVSVARNAGLAMARGDFVAFLDADDVWHADRLRLAAMQVSLHPGGGLWACTWRREGRRLDRLPARSSLARRTHEVGRDRLLRMNRFQTSTVLARRRTVEAAGGFDPARDGAEDWDLWTRMAGRAPVWLSGVAMVTYRTGTARVSHDALRVYRRGLAMLAAQGAAPADIAWHHLRFAYALWRRGHASAAREAYAAYRSVAGAGAKDRLATMAAFSAFLAWRMARQAGAGAVRRSGNNRIRPEADAQDVRDER